MADNDFGFIADEDVGFIPEEAPTAPKAINPNVSEIANLGKSFTKEAVKEQPLVKAGAGMSASFQGAYPALKDIMAGNFKQVPAEFSDRYAKNLETAGDFGQGAIQGATFGGADELMGAVAAPIVYGASKLAGKDLSLGEAYRGSQKGFEGAYKQAKEDSPYATTAGELAGGIVMTPSLGISGSVERGLGTVGIKAAAKQGARSLVHEIAAKTAAHGLEGAVAGGVQSAFGSEGSLGSEQQKKDILSGAETGAKFGSGVGLLTGGIGGLSEYLGNHKFDSDFLRQLQQKYKDAAETGKSIGNTILGRFNRAEMEKPAVENLANKFLNAEKDVYKDVNLSIEAASKANTPVIATDALNAATDQFMELAGRNPSISLDPAYKELAKQVQNLRSNLLTPEEAIQVKKQLSQFVHDYAAGSPDLIKIGSNLKSGIEDAVERVVPGYKEANAKFAELRGSGREVLAGKGYSPEFTEKVTSDLRNPKEKLTNDIHSLFNDLSSGTGNSGLANYKINELGKQMQDLETKYPGTMKSMGYDSVNDMISDITKEADRFAANQKIMGSKFAPGTTSNPAKMAAGLAGTAEAQTFKGAQFLGVTKNKLSKAAQKPASQAIKSIFNMPTEMHHNIADTLMQSNNPLAQQYGQSLKKSLESGNMASQNAALFVIQQNPKLRSLITPEEETPNE